MKKGMAVFVLAVFVTSVSFASPTGSVIGISSRGENVLVFLEPIDGTPMPEWPQESPVLDQVNKTFVPFVMAAPVGKPIIFRNSENLLHNVHPLSIITGGTMFNIAMPVAGMEIPRTFATSDIIAVLCDVHPEMEAYIIVMETPLNAVTDENGAFTISNVPAGTYQVKWWNVKMDEKFGDAGSITVADGPVTISF